MTLTIEERRAGVAAVMRLLADRVEHGEFANLRLQAWSEGEVVTVELPPSVVHGAQTFGQIMERDFPTPE